MHDSYMWCAIEVPMLIGACDPMLYPMHGGGGSGRGATAGHRRRRERPAAGRGVRGDRSVCGGSVCRQAAAGAAVVTSTANHRHRHMCRHSGYHQAAAVAAEVKRGPKHYWRAPRPAFTAAGCGNVSPYDPRFAAAGCGLCAAAGGAIHTV